jgi:hypothetical protein
MAPPDPKIDPVAEFERALHADSTVLDVARPGALSITEVLDSRSWWDARRQAARRSSV